MIDSPNDELNKDSLFNSHEREYEILNIIIQMMLLIKNYVDGDSERASKLYKSLLLICSGKTGRDVINYFLTYGAATSFTLQKRLGYQQQTIYHNLRSLEDIHFVSHRKGVESNNPVLASKRGPKTLIYKLIGATHQAEEKAIIEHMKLKNPDRIKKEEERIRIENGIKKEKDRYNQLKQSFRETLETRDQAGTIVKVSTKSKLEAYLRESGVEGPELERMVEQMRFELNRGDTIIGAK